MKTAQLLTDADVGVLPDLREHEREGEWVEDFAAAVRRAFDTPEREAWSSSGTAPPGRWWSPT